MKRYSILSVLAVGTCLVSQAAQAVTCLPNLLPSNPDTAYIVPAIDDGTVTHALTGLTWKRCSEGLSWVGGTCTGTVGTYAWGQALKQAVNDATGGHSDWRLPNQKELRSLVEECRSNPAINDAIFPNTDAQVYWSSTPYTDYSGVYSWGVDFSGGADNSLTRGNAQAVRLVRGGDYFDSLAPTTTALLSVSASGTGAGTVATTGTGITPSLNCGIAAGSLSGSCLGTLQGGSTVVLTATPQSGSNFAGWGGACAGQVGSCTLTLPAVPAAQNVLATFSGGSGVTLPGKPTNLSATSGNTQASIAFTPPSNGGDANVTYTASCAVGSATPITASGTASPLTVTPLTNGIEYSCTVKATNSVGSGPVSDPVSVTPNPGVTVPDPPTGLSASPGDKKATISFTAPVSDGGSAITGYTASCAVGSATPITASGTASPLTVTPLINGTAYSCTVLAKNIKGNGLASVPVQVTPIAVTYTLKVYTYGLLGGSVTSSPAPINGSGSPCGPGCMSYAYTYSAGTEVTLTASPAGNLVGWYDPYLSGNSATYSMTISADKSVSAFFQYGPLATILPTTPLVFAEQKVGVTSSPQTVTLSNVGSDVLTITSPESTGDYAIGDNNCGLSLGAGSYCTFNISFTPTVSGIRTGTVKIVSNAPGSPHTISLTGTGAATAAISLSPTDLVFADQAVNTTSTKQTVTLTNSGTAALTIASIVPNGEFAVTNNCGGGLGVHGQCSLYVTFTPTTTGTKTGSIRITSDAAQSPHTIGLSDANGQKATQTIEFKTVPSFAAGGSANLQATASSGFAVAFTNGTPAICSLSGSSVLGLAAGICTITASQAGDVTTYQAALSVTQNITITPSNTPVCQLTAVPTRISKAGDRSTLTATCIPTALSYAWTGTTTCDTTSPTCVVTPAKSTGYTVTGARGSDQGSPAGARVTVGSVDLTPILMLLLD